MKLDNLLKAVEYITTETICTGNTATRFEVLTNDINRADSSLAFCRRMQQRNPAKYAAIIPQKETEYNNAVKALAGAVREYIATRPNIAEAIATTLTA